MSSLLSDYDYVLPEELIAQWPLARRDESRMMVLHRSEQRIEHRKFAELGDFLPPGDLLVLNDTRVLCARRFSDDGKIEFLFLEQFGPARWKCLVRPGRKMRVGAVTKINGVQARVEEICPDGERVISLESEENLKNKGVSACAVCDGALPRFRNKPLIVVGGGDSAAEEGSYLCKFASEVHLVHRRDKLRASPVMADRILANPKVRPVWDSAIQEVLGDDERGMTAVLVKNLKSGATRQIDATGMFVAIGHTPNTKFLGGQVETGPQGFIVLKDAPHTTTSVEGVFAAGDVADSIYKQAITAAGMGCKAALDAEKWLAHQGSH
jgi:hypothetical protein